MFRPQREAAPARPLHLVAHHRLVDRADLLHVQGAIRKALPVEHQQRVQHAVDATVGDPGGLELLVHDPGQARRPSLQEGELVGVEELAVAGRQLEAGVTAAVEDQAEEGEQPGVSAVALVHGVGRRTGVRAQATVEPRDRVVVGVYLAPGHQALVLGVEHEDHAHDQREQPPIDVRGVFAGGLREDALALIGIGGLETPQELPERAQYLVGKSGGNVGLVLSALGEQIR